MKFQSECDCECHTSAHKIIHQEPCCVPDNEIENWWELYIKTQDPSSFPEEVEKFLKLTFYCGTYSMIIYFQEMLKSVSNNHIETVLSQMKRNIELFFEEIKNEARS